MKSGEDKKEKSNPFSSVSFLHICIQNKMIRPLLFLNEYPPLYDIRVIVEKYSGHINDILTKI